MNILVSGSTGLIGSELCLFLSKNNHRIVRLVRHADAGPDEIRWDPSRGILDTQALERLDAVVHLAGENIASGRWTEKKKRRIRESRINGTRTLAQSLSHLFDPPKVLVSLSAVGYYGNRGDEQLNEECASGDGFLPDLCREWETATQAAVIRGIRVVIPRVGIVLSARGGAMARMLPFFRLGLGGRIGSGRQYMSWIALEDLLRVIHHAILTPSLHGPVNAVSPNPVTNRDFSQALGRALSRPARFVLPAFAARIAFGRMADEALLASARVTPARLAQSGFAFHFPELDGALRHLFINRS
jgi:uncharacterized protein (TIGR01777 family)